MFNILAKIFKDPEEMDKSDIALERESAPEKTKKELFDEAVNS